MPSQTRANSYVWSFASILPIVIAVVATLYIHRNDKVRDIKCDWDSSVYYNEDGTPVKLRYISLMGIVASVIQCSGWSIRVAPLVWGIKFIEYLFQNSKLEVFSFSIGERLYFGKAVVLWLWFVMDLLSEYVVWQLTASVSAGILFAIVFIFFFSMLYLGHGLYLSLFFRKHSLFASWLNWIGPLTIVVFTSSFLCYLCLECI